jgi:hypothetical protein
VATFFFATISSGGPETLGRRSVPAQMMGEASGKIDG